MIDDWNMRVTRLILGAQNNVNFKYIEPLSTFRDATENNFRPYFSYY